MDRPNAARVHKALREYIKACETRSENFCIKTVLEGETEFRMLRYYIAAYNYEKTGYWCVGELVKDLDVKHKQMELFDENLSAPR
jgi:hypothetical protein